MSKYINPFTQYRMSDSWEGHISRGNSRGGLDYAMGIGTPITAPINGRLENRPNSGNGRGNWIRFHHGDGWIDEFLHLKDGGFVAEGNYSQGQVIGYSGNTGDSTGPHVHWHLVAPDGTRVNPLDAVKVHADNAAAEAAAKAAKAAQAAKAAKAAQTAKAAAEAAAAKKKKENDMYHNKVKENGWHYVVGQEYIRLITADEIPRVTWNMGNPVELAGMGGFVIWCRALNIPESVVRGLSTTNRTWSRLSTITGGSSGGATAEQIAAAVDATLKDDFAAVPKAVNDDMAKRLEK